MSERLIRECAHLLLLLLVILVHIKVTTPKQLQGPVQKYTQHATPLAVHVLGILIGRNSARFPLPND